DDTEYVLYNLSISCEPSGSEANTGAHVSFDPNLAVPCLPLLNGFVRLAYCKNVRIAFSGPGRLTEEQLRGERDRLFANLIAQETRPSVDRMFYGGDRGLGPAERPVIQVRERGRNDTDNFDHGGRPEAFTEDFFISLALRGVHTVDVMMPGIVIDVGPALAFGFAEPISGGRRVLTGVRCANGADFLQQKASELDGGDSFDFELSIMNLAGDMERFEKYQKDGGKWLINDLENRVAVTVEKTDEKVEIKVLSPQ
ncbi:hypothetical protein AAVH_28682, partial [Aphelenchoides avenae]